MAGVGTKLTFDRVPPPPTAALIDTNWELHTLIEGGGPEGPATSASPARLRFSSDGTFEGSTGCRRITGKWTENGDEILFTRFRTHGSCSSADLKDQDDHVVGVLGDGFTAEIEGQELTLSRARGEGGLAYSAD